MHVNQHQRRHSRSSTSVGTGCGTVDTPGKLFEMFYSLSTLPSMQVKRYQIQLHLGQYYIQMYGIKVPFYKIQNEKPGQLSTQELQYLFRGLVQQL